jgi:hypothetical protein
MSHRRMESSLKVRASSYAAPSGGACLPPPRRFRWRPDRCSRCRAIRRAEKEVWAGPKQPGSGQTGVDRCRRVQTFVQTFVAAHRHGLTTFPCRHFGIRLCRPRRRSRYSNVAIGSNSFHPFCFKRPKVFKFLNKVRTRLRRNLMSNFSLCRDYCDRTRCFNFNQFLLVVSLSWRVLSGISPVPLNAPP